MRSSQELLTRICTEPTLRPLSGSRQMSSRQMKLSSGLMRLALMTEPTSRKLSIQTQKGQLLVVEIQGWRRYQEITKVQAGSLARN
jgi:hypothetical protein